MKSFSTSQPREGRIKFSWSKRFDIGHIPGYIDHLAMLSYREVLVIPFLGSLEVVLMWSSFWARTLGSVSLIALLTIISAPSIAADLTINDPAGGGSSSYIAGAEYVPDISILSVYETRSDHSFGYHPQGTANVHVHKPAGGGPMAPLVLVLSSYEPTNWILDVEPGANISQVILNGLHPQEVTNADSIPVENRSGSGRFFSPCAYRWPGDNQGCDTQSLVQGVENLVGVPVTAFAGAYRATDFSVVGSAVPEPSSVILLGLASALFCSYRR